MEESELTWPRRTPELKAMLALNPRQACLSLGILQLSHATSTQAPWVLSIFKAINMGRKKKRRGTMVCVKFIDSERCLERWSQGVSYAREFKTSLGSIVRRCLKMKKGNGVGEQVVMGQCNKEHMAKNTLL